MGRPFPIKIAHSHGGFGPPSHGSFLGPIRVLNRNGISISAAVFAGAGLTSVTDTTDNIVSIGRIYVRM